MFERITERAVNILLVLTAIAALVALAFGAKKAWGAEAELVREVPVSDDVKTDIKKNVQEMFIELNKRGCLLTRWFAFADFSGKPKIVVVVQCVEWFEGNSHAPSEN